MGMASIAHAGSCWVGHRRRHRGHGVRIAVPVLRRHRRVQTRVFANGAADAFAGGEVGQVEGGNGVVTQAAMLGRVGIVEVGALEMARAKSGVFGRHERTASDAGRPHFEEIGMPEREFVEGDISILRFAA